jgi:hypothetical protein
VERGNLVVVQTIYMRLLAPEKRRGSKDTSGSSTSRVQSCSASPASRSVCACAARDINFTMTTYACLPTGYSTVLHPRGWQAVSDSKQVSVACHRHVHIM